jgi:hypothetical protein
LTNDKYIIILELEEDELFNIVDALQFYRDELAYKTTIIDDSRYESICKLIENITDY